MTTKPRQGRIEKPSPEQVWEHLTGDAPLSQMFDYPDEPELHAAERQARDWLAFIVATQGVNRRAGE